ncbi:hypothetical protein HYY69_00025 [Candidatus Woesearchaeota archaeon]|nr:hypothetical protein [Candidatus Woesearchaeota archaeon]
MVGVQSLEARVDRGVFNRLSRVISDGWDSFADYIGHDYHLTVARMHDRLAGRGIFLSQATHCIFLNP